MGLSALARTGPARRAAALARPQTRMCHGHVHAVHTPEEYVRRTPLAPPPTV